MAQLKIKHLTEKKQDDFRKDLDTKIDGIRDTEYYNNLYTFGTQPVVYYFGEFEFKNQSNSPPSLGELHNITKENASKQLSALKYFDENEFDMKTKASVVQVLMNVSNNKTPTYRFIIAITKSEIITTWNPKVTFENSDEAKTTKPVKSASKTKATKTLTTPSKTNLAIDSPSGDYHVLEVILGEINIYTNVVSNIFKLFQQRVNMFNIQFDKPFSAEELSINITTLSTAVRKHLPVGISENTRIKMVFNEDFDDLVELWYLQEQNNQPVWIKTYDLFGAQASEVFLNNTPMLNSLIFNSIKIYNRYWNSFQHYDSGSKIFKSEDRIEDFLKTYIRPKVFILNTSVTRNIISKLEKSKYSSKYVLDKFILGDNRLLDDEYFEAYRLSSDEIKAGAFKSQLQKGVSQQYEKIGDFLGEKWLSGKFKEINSVEEFYDDLVNYINIDELIVLAAKCLLKVLPLQDLLDAICDPVLENWDRHKEAIIQELETMEDGIAKNVARDLKDLYFSAIEKQGVALVRQEVQSGFQVTRKVGETVVDYVGDKWDLSFAYTNAQWSSEDNLIKLIENNKSSIERKVNLLIRGNRSIISQIISNEKKLAELEEQSEDLNVQLKVFGGNPPEQFKTQLKYYGDNIKKASDRDNDLKALYVNLLDQLKIHSLMSAYDFDALLLRDVDVTEKTAINKFLDDFTPLTKATSESVIPNLINQNPYISTAEKDNILNTINFKSPSGGSAAFLQNMGELTKKLSLKNNFIIQYIPGKKLGSKGNFKFDFSATDEDVSLKQQRKVFDLNLKNLEVMLSTIDELNSTSPDVPGSPFSVDKGIAKLSNFGHATIQAALDEIFNDETNRYYLCLAIFAAIPAAAYLAYQLINDADVIGEYFKDQGKAIWKGLKKRFELFARTDYPVMDMLEEMRSQLVQIGINLARDLILNGIMALLGELRDLCDDEDKINSPYNPLGAVDLSSFMTASKKNPNSDQPPESVEDTESFGTISLIDPGITGEQFETILESLSEAFTIKEVCSLLGGTAGDGLYKRAIGVLEGLNFLKEPEKTPFYKFYVESGIFGVKQFFAIISKDIEPAYCEQAVANFEKEKSVLLEICFGRDDSVLEQLICKDLPPDECLKALAAKAEMPKNLAKKLVDNLGNLFDQNLIPDPCAEGEGLFDDSQKFGASKIGESVFGSIEKSFESDISKVKDVFLDTYSTFKNNALFGENAITLKTLTAASIGTDPNVKKEANKIREKVEPQQEIVASKILQGFEGAISGDNFSTNFSYFSSEFEDVDQGLYSNSIKEMNLSFGSEKNNTGKTISFSFDTSQDVVQSSNWNTELRTGIAVKDDSNGVINKSTLAAQRYINLSGSNGWGVKLINPDSDDPQYMVRPPDHLLFGLDINIAEIGAIPSPGIAIYEPWSSDISFGSMLGQYSIENKIYERLFTGALKDLLASSFKEGLYDREKFLLLHLNKFIDITSDTCFLGFMNADVLNKNMQQLAGKLACYNPNNPAINPVNVAMIKLTLDCVVRIIVVKEMMKSLFVYGIFPQELNPDSTSFYTDLLIAELKHYIPLIIGNSNSAQKYETFYNEIVKKFITDIMRILYQDPELNDVDAFRRLIATQFNFVKSQLYNAFTEAYPEFPEKISQIKPTEYQIIQDALTPKNNNIDPYESLKTLNTKDKVEALQNDYFTLYLNSYNNASAMQDIGATTSVLLTNNPYPRFPIFQREARDVEYMDFGELSKVTSFDIKEVLQGNDDGIVLEKMIELGYNSNFFDNNPDGLIKFRNFLTTLCNLGFNEKSGSTAGLRVGTLIKNMFYETKLIMFFPQLKRIIDSFDKENDIWTVYGSGLSLLFEAMFFYNFDMLDKSSAAKNYLMNVIEHEALNKHIDWALTGKLYLNDMKNLINSFAYPWWGKNWKELKDKNQLLASENVFVGTIQDNGIEQDQTPIKGVGYGDNTAGDLIMHDYSAEGLKAWIPERRNSLRTLRKYIAEDLEGELGQKTLNAIDALIAEPWLAAGTDNFFTHLFKTPMAEIIQINPCIRLNAYVEWSKVDASALYNIIAGEKTQELKKQKALLQEKAGRVMIRSVKDEEQGINISQRNFFSTPLFISKKNIPNSIKFNWLNMFMKINKDVAKDYDEYFEMLLDQPAPGEQNFNLFTNLSLVKSSNNQTNDIYNFVESFDVITPINVKEQKSKWTYRYESTQWFNIRGIAVPKEHILEHVELGADAASDTNTYLYGWDDENGYSGINFVHNDGFNEEVTAEFGTSNPYIYLTDSSLASLQENAAFFLNEDGTTLKDEWINPLNGKPAFYPPPTKQQPYPEDDPFQYVDNKFVGTDDSWSRDKAFYLGSIADGGGMPEEQWKTDTVLGEDWWTQSTAWCKVGMWDIVSPITGEIIHTAPKWIAIRAYSTGDNNQPDNFYWIDWGWWTKTDKKGGPFKQEAEAIYPGSLFAQAPNDREPRWMSLEPDAGAIEVPNPVDGAFKSQEGLGVGQQAPYWVDLEFTDIEKEKQSLIKSLLEAKKDVGSLDDDEIEEINDKIQQLKSIYPESHPFQDKLFLSDFTQEELEEALQLIKAQADTNKPKGFGSTGQWYGGFMQGGIWGVEKKPQEIPLEPPLKSSAYSILETILTDAEKAILNDLLKIFFIREQTTIVAVMNKLLAEKYYPILDTLFDNSLSVAFNALQTALASANGDWKYTSGKTDTGGISIDLGAISGEILKMFLGAIANTVDPTWKTDWFKPGPFTPFGIAAKMLDENGDIFKGGPSKAGDSMVAPIPAFCDDTYDEQIKLLNDLIKAQNKGGTS